MTTATPPPQEKPSRLFGTVVLAVVLTGGLTLVLLILAGVFTPKVPTDSPTESPATTYSEDVVEVRLVRRPRFETAIGTVKAVHEAAVAAKLLARVVEVKVKAGQPVAQNQVLARLDDSDLQARVKQAEANFATAKAAREKAELEYQRARRLIATRAISQTEFEQISAASSTAMAEMSRAQQALREANIVLGYATLRAPINGMVIDKRVEAGDTVTPGQILLSLYDPTRMQMIVSVRESLGLRLSIGQKVPGRLEALGLDCEATVSEIVPEAQTASRSFTVKVTGPCPPGVYSGMFGRISIPLEDEEIIVLPSIAVRRAGQLDLVQIVQNGTVYRRSVQLGRTLDKDVEVLAGLKPGEKVLLPSRRGAREGRP